MIRNILPLRPIPIQDESPASILHRAAESNGYISILQLLAAYNFPSRGYEWVIASFTDQLRFAEILKPMGISTEASGLAFSRTGPTSRAPREVLGIGIPEKFFHKEGSHFCPDCLKERMYWRRGWILRLYPVCQSHHKFLVYQCTACGKKLQLERPRLGHCPCGHDLRMISSEKADTSIVTWWSTILRNSTQSTRDQLLQFFEVLSDFDGLEVNPKTDYSRMQIVKNWYQNHSYIDKSILMRIENRAAVTHPRLQLLPFLSRKGVLADYAKRVLDAYKTPVPTNAQQLAQRDLSVSATAVALGLEHSQVKQLVKLGLIQKNLHRDQKIKVPAYEVEKLLRASSISSELAYNSDGQQNRISIVKTILSIQLGQSLSAGYNLAKGLCTLRILGGYTQTQAPSCWLDVNQSASRLEIHPEIVRSLIKKKILPASYIKTGRIKKICVKDDDIAYFKMNYSTSGNLAKLAGANATNFSEKLMHIGKRPITGPKIDGGFVYVFDRNAIGQDDLLLAKTLQSYETTAGRKIKKRKVNEVATGLTLVETANSLGISQQKVLMLARKKIIKKIDVAHRKVMIEIASVENVLATLKDPRLMSLEDAVNQLGETKRCFFSTWVMVGAIQVTDLSAWRLVSKESVNRILKLKEDYMTGKEAGIYLGIHSTHMRNLHRKGIVEPTLLKGRRKMYLYLRSDVENLKHCRVCDQRGSKNA